MLHTLDLKGFRGFGSYRLSGLTRVNLLVGKNNCGKTSVLEAIELLASGGNPRVLYNSLKRRGEKGTRRMHEPVMDVAHIFHGHACAPGVSFELSSNNGKRTLKVKILSLEEVEDRRVERWRRSRLFDPDEEGPPPLAMHIDRGVPGREILLPVMEDGTIGIGYERYPRLVSSGHSGTPVHFLTLDAFDPASMGKQWDTVLEEGVEAEIVADMKLLVPDLDSIVFLTSDNTGSSIRIGLRNDRRRVPIGAYGDGMRQLLALRLSFVGASNGVLLIDEIDAGLHWTVMEDVWQFVVEVASRLNVQVFATTHSFDCIRGLGSLLRNRPELEEQVCLQRVTRLLSKAVCLQADQIRVAVEQDIEVR